MMMNNNNDVRCYELSSGMNKTFKVSRMSDVLLLDLEWGNESRHKHMFTDIFMFSGDEPLPVEVQLDRLAYNLMLEEYPGSDGFIVQQDDAHWLFRGHVASYVGISRFVLGLYDHVKVLGSEAFRSYLSDRLRLFASL